MLRKIHVYFWSLILALCSCLKILSCSYWVWLCRIIMLSILWLGLLFLFWVIYNVSGHDFWAWSCLEYVLPVIKSSDAILVQCTLRNVCKLILSNCITNLSYWVKSWKIFWSIFNSWIVSGKNLRAISLVKLSIELILAKSLLFLSFLSP